MLNAIKNLVLPHFIFLAALIVLIPLLFRNPYSERTLIPNFEPFPDTFHYTVPPRCLLAGQGFTMCRINNPEIAGINPSVPPLYSLSLLPGYLVNFDPRTFYFINVLLAFSSVALLYRVANNFFKNKFITELLLLLYFTSYFVYWLPTLAMAENLLHPLFLLGILLLQTNVSTKKAFLASLVSVGLYATKYSLAPLAVTFTLTYAAKIALSRTNNLKLKARLKTALTNKKTLQQLGILAIPIAVFLLFFGHIAIITNFFTQISSSVSEGGRATAESSYFSLQYFTNHLRAYTNALIGQSQRFLWDRTPLTPQWVALPGLAGLFISITNKKQLLPKAFLIFSVVAQMLFIALFYVVDVRYVYHLLIVLLLGFGFFLQFINTKLNRELLFNGIIVAIAGLYLISNFSRLKSQVALNLKYAETPWWFLSQKQMNNYFNQVSTKGEKPVLITLAAPYLTDFYSDGNYKTLPLSEEQDFRSSFAKVWGAGDYSNLTNLYKTQLREGQAVFVTNYGTSATGAFTQAFNTINETFNLKQVQSGCHDLCNIYRLELKGEAEG